MSTLQIGLMFGAATFIALFSGMPIAFAVGGVALVFMLLYMPSATVALVAETLYSELDNFVLLTIPLFVLMGAAAAAAALPIFGLGGILWLTGKWLLVVALRVVWQLTDHLRS